MNREAVLHRVKRAAANGKRPDLRGADLYEANLAGADLSGANLRGANLAGANLSGADLSGADLRGANLGETHVLQLGPLGSRRAYLVVARHPDGEVECATGCFRGTLNTFTRAVTATHGDSTQGRAYRAAIVFLRAWLALLPPVPVQRGSA